MQDRIILVSVHARLSVRAPGETTVRASGPPHALDGPEALAGIGHSAQPSDNCEKFSRDIGCAVAAL